MGRSRLPRHSWTRVLSALVFLALVTVLAWDVSTVLLREPSRVDLADDSESKDFTATLELSDLALDTAGGIGTATLALHARAQDDKHPIRTIALGYRRDAESGDGLDWIYFDASDDQLTGEAAVLATFEEWDPETEVFVDTAELLAELEFPIESLRPELLYPFDRHLLDLRLRACVNDRNACLDRDNVAIRFITVALDPGLDIQESNGGGISIVLGRKRFLKLVTGIFFVLSLLFFSYLLRWTQGVELFGKSLGFLASLWGIRQLIVPKSIEIFPTIVDYVVLLLFCGVFLLILSKALAEMRGQEMAAPEAAPKPRRSR